MSGIIARPVIARGSALSHVQLSHVSSVIARPVALSQVGLLALTRALHVGRRRQDRGRHADRARDGHARGGRAKRDAARDDLGTAADGPLFQILLRDMVVDKRMDERALLAVAIAEALQQPDVAKRLRGMTVEAIGNTPAEMALFMREERERWGNVIRFAKVAPAE